MMGPRVVAWRLAGSLPVMCLGDIGGGVRGPALQSSFGSGFGVGILSVRDCHPTGAACSGPFGAGIPIESTLLSYSFIWGAGLGWWWHLV